MVPISFIETLLVQNKIADAFTHGASHHGSKHDDHRTSQTYKPLNSEQEVVAMNDNRSATVLVTYDAPVDQLFPILTPAHAHAPQSVRSVPG